jgi:hypothetical protein
MYTNKVLHLIFLRQPNAFYISIQLTIFVYTSFSAILKGFPKFHLPAQIMKEILVYRTGSYLHVLIPTYMYLPTYLPTYNMYLLNRTLSHSFCLSITLSFILSYTDSLIYFPSTKQISVLSTVFCSWWWWWWGGGVSLWGRLTPQHLQSLVELRFYGTFELAANLP